MATDRRKIQIEASLDASGFRQGVDDIKDAGRDLAKSVEASSARAAEGVDAIGDRASGSAKNLSAAERSMVHSIQRATAAMQAGGKAGSDYYEMLAKQRGVAPDVLKPYIDQLRQAEAAQKALTRANVGLSDKQVAAAMRGVPAQFTDIFVSLQGGQNPLTVLLQQGGQLKDMFGGVGLAARALGGYVLGLVNPFTVAAAAAATLGLAYYQGSKEADAYAKSIIMSGNAVGTSVDALAEMAQVLDGKGFTQGAAAEALAKLAGTGKVAEGQLTRVAEAALKLERDAGIPIDQTVKAFEELGKSPVEASKRLNEAHHYLTAEIYQQIKALQDQGKEADAARVAQDAYADAMVANADKLQDRLGIIERAWRSIKSVAKEAWDAMLNIGRPDTLEDKIGKAQASLDKMEAEGPGLMERGIWGKKLDRARSELSELEAQRNERDWGAAGDAERDRVQSAGIKAAESIAKVNAQAATKQEQMNAALSEYRTQIEALRQADPTSALLDPDKIAKAEDAIRERFTDKKKATGAKRVDLSDLQVEMREELALADRQQRALDQRRSAGLLSEADYYAQKRDLLEQSGAMEKKALQEQLERLRAQGASGKQINEVIIKQKLKEIELGNKLAAIDQDAATATARQDAALQGLAATHARYLEQLERQAQRTVSTAYMGDRDRQRAQGQWGIEDRYSAEQRRLEDQRMFTVGLTPEQRQQIDARLAYLQVEQSKEVALYQQTYAQLDVLQTDWVNGAGQAFSNYAASAADVAGQAASAFSNAFRGMEDALVSFATTGKLNFKDLAQSIIADIIRIQVRAAMSGILGNLMGNLGGSVGNAGYGNYSSAGLQSAFGYASGGYTGSGGKYEPAGIVHRGEYVINAESTRKLGLGYLSRLNGYANGGLVGGGAPAPGGVVVNINNQSGAQIEQTSRRGADGTEIIDVFIKQAVGAVAGQLASDSGPVGQAMRQRSKMGM